MIGETKLMVAYGSQAHLQKVAKVYPRGIV